LINVRASPCSNFAAGRATHIFAKEINKSKILNLVLDKKKAKAGTQTRLLNTLS